MHRDRALSGRLTFFRVLVDTGGRRLPAGNECISKGEGGRDGIAGRSGRQLGTNANRKSHVNYGDDGNQARADSYKDRTSYANCRYAGAVFVNGVAEF
jgi:hypothetical protein